MNKAQVRTDFLALLNRNDCTEEQANAFLTQAHARIQRTLRIPPMERGNLLTTNAEEPDLIVLPSDLLDIKYVFTDDGLIENADLGRVLRYAKSLGHPQYYTRIQGSLKLAPVPYEGTEITIIYYGEIPALVNDTDENYLSVAAPDLLMYGALCFAADFFIDERKPLFEEAFDRIYKELVEQAQLLEMSTSGMSIAPSTNLEY